MVHPSEPCLFHKQGAYIGAPVSKRGVDEGGEDKMRRGEKKEDISSGQASNILILSLLVDSHLQLSKLKLLITGLIQTETVYSPFLFCSLWSKLFQSQSDEG